MSNNKKLKMNFIILDRIYESKFIKTMKKQGFIKYFLFYAKGSASSDILDYLGIGESEKEVLVYPTSEKDSDKLFHVISESEFMKKVLAFKVPVKGISSKKSLEYFLKEVVNNE